MKQTGFRSIFFKCIFISSILFVSILLISSRVSGASYQKGLPDLQQQATAEPNYLEPQLLLEASVDLEKCFFGYISAGMAPCDAPGTDPIHIDDVWPQTIQYLEFTLDTDSLLILEAHREITDSYPGSLGIDLHYFDPDQGKWVGVQFSWETGTNNDRGDIWGNFDSDWVNQIQYDQNHLVHPAGQYRIVAWAAVRYESGAVYGYYPSKGSLKLYAFENIPPAATPQPEIAPTDSTQEQATATESPDSIIELSAWADGYEEKLDYLDNRDNFATIIVTGHVTDQITGMAIEGATLSIDQGAQGASVLSAADGSYSLTVVIPGGEGSGQLSELDFQLTPLVDLTIDINLAETELLADGSSTTQVTIQVRDFAGKPLPDRDFSLTLDGDIGPGTIQPDQATTDQNGEITAIYTTFKPQPGTLSNTTRHEINIIATDLATGAKGNESIFVNQYVLTVSGGEYVPACTQCDFPVELNILVTDYWLNPIPDASLNITIGGNAGKLMTDLTADTGEESISVTTDGRGHAKVYYRYEGVIDIQALTQEIVVLDEMTQAQVIKNIQVHGIDLAISRIEEAGFTGVTGHQAFLKIYFKEFIHPDLPLDRFNSEFPNKLQLHLSIFQYHSDGENISIPYEAAGMWEQDEKGYYLKMFGTPSMPFVTPVNDGTTWYEIRLDPIADGVFLPDQFRGNNDTIFALTTGSPDGWLHIWLKDGILTPKNWVGVAFKCVLRFVPTIGDAITVIDTLNQVYNQDLVGLGQSTAQVWTDSMHRIIDPKGKEFLGTAVNNVVSCLQDAYGVYKQRGNASIQCGLLAAEIPPNAVHNQTDAELKNLLSIYQDRFIHGLLNDTPELRAVVVVGLDAEKLALRNNMGNIVDDPSLVNAQGPVSVFILPATETYQFEATTGEPFTLAIYDANTNQGQRITTRHEVQTETTLIARITLGPTSDNLIQTENFEDGGLTNTLTPQISILDTVKPEITTFSPSEGETVTVNDRFLMASFVDNTGGVGIDSAGVKIFIDGIDFTSKAKIQNDRLSLAVSDIGLGQHSARLIVSDLDGNSAVVEWMFVVKDANTLSFLTPAIIVLLSGGVLLAVILVIGLLFFTNRQRNQKSSWKVSQSEPVKDHAGYWWWRHPETGEWHHWNGQHWQSTGRKETPANLESREPLAKPHNKLGAGLRSWIAAGLIGGLMFLLVFGGVTLVGLQFVPSAQIQPAEGITFSDILVQFGGGLLVGLVGLLSLRGGIKSILTRRAYSEDEWGNRREQRSCSAVMSGILGALFGFVIMTAGMLLAAYSVFQQILPFFGVMIYF